MRFFLELCLHSVEAALSSIESEIIVVDNNSTDDSCSVVERQFPKVKLIRNRENLGFSKANNIGVAQAQGEYVCILNPDTVVAEDTFSVLLQYAESKNNLGILGCRLIDGTGHFLPESKRHIPTPWVSFKKIIGFPKAYYFNQLKSTETGQVAILVGAFMLLKREVYRNIGGFDEDYFMYGEDVDISYKALQQGYHNYYYGATSIIHFKGESTTYNHIYYTHFYSAMKLFYTKHFANGKLASCIVALGIKWARLISKPPKPLKRDIDNYLIFSKQKKGAFHSGINNNATVVSQLKDLKPNTQIVFDGNTLSYTTIITAMQDETINSKASFKILPKNTNFILGSNSSKNRGEVTILVNA